MKNGKKSEFAEKDDLRLLFGQTIYKRQIICCAVFSEEICRAW